METGAIICNMSDLVENLIYELLAHRVMTTSIVIRSIFLSSDHLFGMEKAAVGASADFVDHVRLEIAVNCSGHIFSITLEVVPSVKLRNGVIQRLVISSPVSEKKVLNP